MKRKGILLALFLLAAEGIIVAGFLKGATI